MGEQRHQVHVYREALPDDWRANGLVHRAVLDNFNDLSAHEIYACGTAVKQRAAFTPRGLPEAFFPNGC